MSFEFQYQKVRCRMCGEMTTNSHDEKVDCAEWLLHFLAKHRDRLDELIRGQVDVQLFYKSDFSSA